MDLMVDVETLGVEPGCAIVQIAAVVFDPEETQGTQAYFDMRISLSNCVARGLVIEPGAFHFWRKQPLSLQERIFDEKAWGIEHVLLSFNDWLNSVNRDYEIKRFWSRSINFDFPILEAAYKRILGSTRPPMWKDYNNFRKIHEVRTAIDLFGVTLTPADQGNKHDALADCYRQVKDIQNVFKRRKELLKTANTFN